jgi:hypothetical protein
VSQLDAPIIDGAEASTKRTLDLDPQRYSLHLIGQLDSISGSAERSGAWWLAEYVTADAGTGTTANSCKTPIKMGGIIWREGGTPHSIAET